MPIRLSVLRLASAPTRILGLRGGDLLRATDADAAACYRCVFTHVAKLRREYDLIDLQDVSPVDGIWKQLSGTALRGSALRVAWVSHPQTSHGIAIGPTLGGYLDGLKSRDRTNLKRRKKKLWAAVNGDARLDKITSPEQVPAFLDCVHRIHQLTWQAKAFGQRKRNALEDVAYFRALADMGLLRSYLLICRGSAVAFQVGVQYRGTYQFVETGYDLQWADYGPGTVLEYLTIEDLFAADKPDFADFGFGDAEYKRILGNRSRTKFEHVYLATSGSLYGNCLLAIEKSLEKLEMATRHLLRYFRVEPWVRRILKRRRTPG